MIRILQEAISSKCQYGNRLKKWTSILLVFFVMIACLAIPTDAVRAESSEIVTDLSTCGAQPADQQIEDGKTYVLTSNTQATSYRFGYVNYGDGNECNIIIRDLTMVTGTWCSALTFYNANGDWTINLYIDGTNTISAGGWGGLCVNSSQYAGKTTINFCYVNDSSSLTLSGSSGGTQDAKYELPDQYKPEDAVLRTHSIEASLGENTVLNSLSVAGTPYTDINSAFNAAKTSRPLLLTLNHTHTADTWLHNENQHWKICSICDQKFDRADHSGGTATCSAKAVCDTCGESYGELKSTNHSNLKHVAKKAPTAFAEGNTEYWYCDGCDKYYSDENASNEINVEDTVIGKLKPTIIAGDNVSVTQGDKKALSFASDAAFDDFIRAELDGNILSEENYTVKSGSTIVTLNADFVATLSTGEHTLAIVSESGTATAKFTVNAKAIAKDVDSNTDKAIGKTTNKTVKITKTSDEDTVKTGDETNMPLLLALLLVSSCGMVLTTRLIGKK